MDRYFVEDIIREYREILWHKKHDLMVIDKNKTDTYNALIKSINNYESLIALLIKQLE